MMLYFANGLLKAYEAQAHSSADHGNFVSVRTSSASRVPRPRLNPNCITDGLLKLSKYPLITLLF